MKTKRHLPVLLHQAVEESGVSRLYLTGEYERYLMEIRSESPLLCRKGCSNCCHHPVTISLLEGIDIYSRLAENHLWTSDLKEKLGKSSESTCNLAFEVWVLSNMPCPMLNPDNSCSIYEFRPFLCRITASTGDPYYCHPHKLGSPTGILPRAEILAKEAKADAKIFRRIKIHLPKLPLATAVLYGEQICSEKTDIEDVFRRLMIEYMEQG